MIHTKMNAIHITPEVYKQLADWIVDHLDPAGVCDEWNEIETHDFIIEASIKCVVRRQGFVGSDGLDPIVDVGFIWAELRTITRDGDDKLNDFSIDELKSYIITE